MQTKPWLAAVAAGALATTTATADEGDIRGLQQATAWLNSSPLKAADLRGKVVVVDFWTYTCINWLRTLPYVQAWAEKYRDHGLVVVGVHTPEFEFEENADNVRRALKTFGIGYPIATDNNKGVWRAFRNQAWPALHIIDSEGRARFRHFGEGKYEAAERSIQQLLAEAGFDDVPHDLVAIDGSAIEAAADWGNLKSPETYLGYERATGFSSRQGPLFEFRRVYGTPKRLELNHWALAGC